MQRTRGSPRAPRVLGRRVRALRARLFALDDWGDDSHEGELLKYMKGWVAKGERLKTAERMRRGKMQKAKEGKVVATHAPRYGFRFLKNEKGRAYAYEVREDQMGVVRSIFRMVGEEGLTLALARQLPGHGNPRIGQVGAVSTGADGAVQVLPQRRMVAVDTCHGLA